ncbi:rab proteins geranylgeranyltransferase component a 2 [Nannochloropsis oceanica]
MPAGPKPIAPRDDGLEHYYDVVIIGTGLVEAMLAAALTKVGKSVLHYEKHDYYGGEDWPSFRLDDLRTWAEAHCHQGQRTGTSAAAPAELRPTPPVLQRQWPSIRWRTAGGIDQEAIEEDGGKEDKREEKEEENEEEEAGEEEEGEEGEEEEEEDKKEKRQKTKKKKKKKKGKNKEKEKEEDISHVGAGKNKPADAINPEAPAHSWVVPLPQTALTSIRVLQTFERPGTAPVVQPEQPPSRVTENVPAIAAKGGVDQDADTSPRSAPPSPSQPAIKTTNQEATSVWDIPALLAKSREFNIDLSPVVLMAGSDMLGPLLSSGVANYLEFRPFQAFYIASRSLVSPSCSNNSNINSSSSSITPPSESSFASSSSSSGCSTAIPNPPPSLAFHQVPCSKPDVFATHLLPAKEKRQLMKFLQLVADWGFRSQSGKTPQLRNEVELGQGRSLQRPQNKAKVDMEGIDNFLDRPFKEFLNFQRMEGHLQWVVIHALALLVVDSEGKGGTEGGELMATTEEGLKRVWGHLQGLGRYGKTAFLWPLFGGGDVTQAFCRTASVWGATYLLREQPAGVVLHPTTGNCLGVMDRKGGAVACEYVVFGVGNVPEGWRLEGGRDSRKVRSVVRRIVLLDRPPAGLLVGKEAIGGAAGAVASDSSINSDSSSTAKHCGGVIPPGNLAEYLAATGALPSSHPHPTVHFYCVDPAARCAPQGIYILYLSTITCKCRDSTISGSTDAAVELLAAATHALVGSPEDNVLWAVTYELPLEPIIPSPGEEEIVQNASFSSSSFFTAPPLPKKNALFIHRDASEFYLHSPLTQAQTLFGKICPGEEFLPSEVPEGVLHFAFLPSHQEEDQEQAILEKAMARAIFADRSAGSGESEVEREERGK